MNLRNALALGIALTIPYLLLTSHYLSAPPPPPVDLAPYYATINSARALLAEHGAPVQPAQAPPAQPVVAPASSGTKDLVIGLAKEIDAKNLAVFAASLRQTTTNCDLVLFVDRPSIDRTLNTIVERFQVDLIPYDPATLQPVWKSKFTALSPRHRRDACSMAWRCRLAHPTHWMISTQVTTAATPQVPRVDAEVAPDLARARQTKIEEL